MNKDNSMKVLYKVPVCGSGFKFIQLLNTSLLEPLL